MQYQSAIRKCHVEGHQIAYHRSGRGETVLLVHGITTYSFIWRQITPRLTGAFDVIAVDLLGCGNSDMPLHEDYSISRQADLLYHFLKTLGIGKVHLVGHDIGGGVCQIMAVRYPELIHDLTLINSVAYDFWPVQPIIAMRTPIIRQLALATLDFGTFKLIVRRGLYHKENLSPELMEFFWSPMKTRQGRKAFLHLAKCLNNNHLLDIADALRALSLPSLIIRGEADIYLSGAIADKLHAEIPGSQLFKIETGGHFIQEDEPQLIAQTLHTFFQTGIIDVS